MPLIRAIYASEKRDEMLTFEQIEGILTDSRVNNARDEITGMLCLSRGFFLQCLEGERAEVNALYNRITRDQRHKEPYLIDYSEIDERVFAHWSMGFVPDTQISRELIIRFSSSGKFDPTRMSAASALGFLKALSKTIS